MDKLQIAHDLAVAKVCAELPGSLDNPHICQKYFKYRAEFADLLDSHDEDYFLNELDKEKVNNCSPSRRYFFPLMCSLLFCQYRAHPQGKTEFCY